MASRLSCSGSPSRTEVFQQQRRVEMKDNLLEQVKDFQKSPMVSTDMEFQKNLLTVLGLTAEGVAEIASALALKNENKKE